MMAAWAAFWGNKVLKLRLVRVAISSLSLPSSNWVMLSRKLQLAVHGKLELPGMGYKAGAL
jgi:hypothetical protein